MAGRSFDVMGYKTVDNRYCRDCVYFIGWFDTTRCCNYLLVTGESRKCPPGSGCTKKIKRKRKRKTNEE